MHGGLLFPPSKFMRRQRKVCSSIILENKTLTLCVHDIACSYLPYKHNLAGCKVHWKKWARTQNFLLLSSYRFMGQ